MNYLLGSGYYHGRHIQQASPGCGRIDQRQFVELWFENLYRFTPSLNHRPVIVSVGDSGFPLQHRKEVRLLEFKGDAGCVFQKPYHISGGTATICALAMLAFCDERDFLHREQDALCFGPWVERMYADLGDGNVLVTHDNVMGYNGSIMLIRHAFLPTFVRQYLSFPPEQRSGMVAEQRLKKLVKECPNDYKVASFGYDRQRPFNAQDEVFFIQQASENDIRILRSHSLLGG